MSSFQEVLRTGTALLKQEQLMDASVDAWLLMEYVFQINRTWYFAHCNEEAMQDKIQVYMELIQRRRRRIPLQHITHQAFFMGREFYVDERVLVPRQDTEILVEEAKKVLRPGDQVLDMCTGSGCILLSLLLEVPGCTGVGSDLSGKALEVARMNRDTFRLTPKEASFQEGDLFEGIHKKEGFDLIISNPPYIPTEEIRTLEPEVREFDPVSALDGREDGLWFYREITSQAGDYLKPKGWLFYEIGWNQAKDVCSFLKEAGYGNIRVIQDLSGLDRVVCGRLEKRQEENHV